MPYNRELYCCIGAILLYKIAARGENLVERGSCLRPLLFSFLFIYFATHRCSSAGEERLEIIGSFHDGCQTCFLFFSLTCPAVWRRLFIIFIVYEKYCVKNGEGITPRTYPGPPRCTYLRSPAMHSRDRTWAGSPGGPEPGAAHRQTGGCSCRAQYRSPSA